MAQTRVACCCGLHEPRLAIQEEKETAHLRRRQHFLSSKLKPIKPFMPKVAFTEDNAV
jgi:hypothetical protein